MSKPTLVFIPGFWEGPAVFSKVINILNTDNVFPTQTIPLASTGTDGPNAKTFSSDVHAIRDAVETLVNKRREILLVMHSAAGYIGSQAIKNLSLAKRQERGQAGGVKKLVYLCGALLPENSHHPPAPFYETMVNSPCKHHACVAEAHIQNRQDDQMRSKDPLRSLFNDFPAAEAERFAKELSWQPSTYIETVHVTYCAWKDIPSVYLCCTQDQVIALEMQRQFADMAGAKMESCDAGHMVVLSQPERVVEFVTRAAVEM